MPITLIGLDYRTAPLALRERLHLTGDALSSALKNLCSQGLAEVAILSTCNRLEIFAVCDEVEFATDLVTNFLVQSVTDLTLSKKTLQPYLYYLEANQAVEHLMRVASGLESLVIGESQILGQVVQALQAAQIACTSGPVLSKLFTMAIHAGKRSRTETGISRNTLSISHTAVDLIQHITNNSLSGMNVLVLGAGEMGKHAAQALKMRNAASVTIVNRTDERAKQLAAKLEVTALPWDWLLSALTHTDGVISTATVIHPILTKALMTSVMKARALRPLILIDVGVPRNIAVEVEDLAGIKRYDIDHLHRIVNHNRQQREEESLAVAEIIQQELTAFIKWLNTREIVPLIIEMRHNTAAMVEAEVERTLHRLPNLSASEQEMVYELAHRIVNKVLHKPTVTIKSRAAYGDHNDYSHAIRQLFALDSLDAKPRPKINKDE